jgi:spore coat polysaccharide biosynthesis protein SpsF (cytidylyltransferase family)
MLKTMGIVSACCGKAAIQAKASRRLGGKSILEWVARRATDCLRLDGVIVLVDDRPASRDVASLVPLDIPVFVARQPDALACLGAALEEYPAEAAVLIGGEELFVDAALLDRLVITADEHPECDYISYRCRDGRPAVLSPVGVYGEYLRTAALRVALRKAKLKADRQHPARYIYSHPERFTIRLIQAPAQIDRDDVRLSVDMEEDWDHAVAIFEALGPEELYWQRIADLLDHQPALRKRMADLNRVRAKG